MCEVRAEAALLLHPDQAEAGVVEDQGHERDLFAHGGFEFLRVHEKAAVAGYREHLALGVDELGGKRPGDADPHRREAVGDDAGVGLVAGVEAGEPHLVRADVGDHDVAAVHHRSQVAEHPLRFQRKRRVGLELLPLLQDEPPQPARVVGALARLRPLRDPVEGGRDISQHAHADDVVFVHLGRQQVDVDNHLVPLRVPALRSVLDQVRNPPLPPRRRGRSRRTRSRAPAGRR